MKQVVVLHVWPDAVGFSFVVFSPQQVFRRSLHDAYADEGWCAHFVLRRNASFSIRNIIQRIISIVVKQSKIFS